MQKEIGSNFWLNKYKKLNKDQIDLEFLDIDAVDTAYLSTGRSAISFVLNNIKTTNGNRIALLPPFTCHTVIEPFMNSGYKVHFFSINKDLSIDSDRFLKDIRKLKPSVILVHGYFGFGTLRQVEDIITRLREVGVVVIEDITQTIYSKSKHINADYYICSLRKWTALPDGAFAISTNNLFLNKPIEIDNKLQESKLNAFHLKYLYMDKNIGRKDVFLKLLYDAEQTLCEQTSIYAMGDVSKKLQANLDIGFLRDRRRENYLILVDGLKNCKTIEPIFLKLLEEVTPLYFPIYVKYNRKELQDYLAKNDIYAPIVWPKPSECEGRIEQQVNWIYDHILCIPCDQRYNHDDMKRIIGVINDYEEKL